MAEALQERSQIEKPLPQALLIAQVALREQKRFAQHLLFVITAALLAFALFLTLWRQSPKPPASPKETPLLSKVAPQSGELAALQRYLGKTLSEVLRLKLATLEQRIRMGQAGLQDLELIASMKQDLKLLTDYRETLRPLGALPAAPLPPSRGWDWAALVWGGLLFAFLAVGSYWLRCWWRLRQLEMELRRYTASG